ncbi:signal recognition particle-docking protein FtsY [Candidatus Desantisbacteria bacterium]|nr:signal recognition particle-docking protein FtsY [Candidatus Desantisbacteria bacterium]
MGKWFNKLKAALNPTKLGFFKFFARDETVWEEIEEAFINTDVGVETALKIVDELRNNSIKPEGLRKALKEKISRILGTQVSCLNFPSGVPAIFLFIGVNGSGKTTTIGKLAFKLKAEGKSVLIAAADTYRAAAIPQLEEWAKRCGVEILKQNEGADPGAVAYDAIDAALARRIDVVLIDTAGRLHTKHHLVHEIKKIRGICEKKIPGAPHEMLLVLDAVSGQNGLIQAQSFLETVGISGIVLTKLDGTAKGGIVISIADNLKVPVKLIGIGEGLEDIGEFDPNEFVEALFGEG